MNYELYEQNWKQLANNKKLVARDFVVRAIIKAMKARVNVPKEDLVVHFLQKYFSPNMRGNGQAKFEAIESAKTIAYHIKPENLTKFWLLEGVLQTPAEVAEFMQLARTMKTDKIGRKYVYYFTAQDMSPEQQGVQAGHALFLLGAKIGGNVDDIYFQWIGVKDSEALKEVRRKHSTPLAKGFKDGNGSYKGNYVEFHEPDQGNRLTALAFEPILWNKRQNFLDYPLLTH